MSDSKELTNDSNGASVHRVVSRAELERAWMAYGFMRFCGTVHDTKIGVITCELQTLGRGFMPGDVVFYREQGKTLCVEHPIEAASLGKSGFIAGVGTTVGIPRHCVLPIDPKSVVDVR